MRPGWLLLSVLWGFPLASCDPCVGIGACGGPAVRYVGEVTRLNPGGPAEGVAVEFRPTGGVPLEVPVIQTRTDENGRFTLEAAAREEGIVRGTLIFFPPEPLDPVEFEDLRLATTRAPGEERFAGSWAIPYPYLPYEASFYHRVSLEPARGIEVEFRRTGGIAIQPDTFRVTTDFWGTVKLRPNTLQWGEVTGELVVFPLPPYEPYTIPNLRMRTFSEERNDSTLIRSGLGPHLPYAGVLVHPDGSAAADVRLLFRRTAGVPIDPEPFVTSTDRFGTFFLNPYPLGSGAIEGDLFAQIGGEPGEVLLRHLVLEGIEVDGPVQHLGYITLPAP